MTVALTEVTVLGTVSTRLNSAVFAVAPAEVTADFGDVMTTGNYCQKGSTVRCKLTRSPFRLPSCMQ